MTIPELPEYVAPFKPVPQVTPFTYRDGMTMLKKLERLQNYINLKLVPFVNENYSELADAFETQVNLLITQVNVALETQDVEVDQKLADLTAYVNEQVQLIINDSIQVQDPVVAGLLEDGESETRAIGDSIYALISTLNDVIGTQVGEVSFAHFSPEGDGITDDTAKLIAAIAATPDGGTLYLGGHDKRYRINSIINITDGRTITLRGGTLVQGANTTILQWTGKFDTILTVSAIATLPETLGDGVSTRVTRLTVPGHSFKWGDVVKVVSDDLIVGARATNARSGEYAVVQKIDGDNVFLSGVLRQFDTYATNVRVAKHLPGALHLDSVNFATLDEGMGVWSSGMVTINAAFLPKWVNVTVEQSTGPVMSAVGCFGYRATNWVVNSLLNEAALGRYGYGINDQGSEYGVIDGMHVVNARHGFTTNALSTDTDDVRLWRYGRTAYSTIVNGMAIGCTNAPWDTHEECFMVTFDNCIARSTVVGNSSGGAGFQARGKRVRFISCVAQDSYAGFSVLSQFGGDIDAPQFINCDSDGITWAVFTINRSAGHNIRIPNVKINGGNFNSRRHFITASAADILIADVDVSVEMLDTISDGIMRINDVKLTLDKVRFDLNSIQGTTPYLIRAEDTSDVGEFLIQGNIQIVGVDNLDAIVRGATLIDGDGKVNLDVVADDTPSALTSNVTNASIMYDAPDGSTVEQPQHLISIPALIASAQSGYGAAAANLAIPGGYMRTSGTDAGSEIHFDIALAKGIYQMRTNFQGDTDGGIVRVLQNDAQIGSFDTYRSPAVLSAGFTNVVVPKTGVYRITLTSTSKNALSSAYRVNFCGLTLVKTT